MDLNYWINTTDYTPTQLILAALGAICWVTVYMIIIRNIRKHKFVEMPFFCVTSNIVWEFIWGFLFSDRIDMGQLYVYSFRAWFFIDLIIFIGIIKYGYKQMSLPEFVKNAKAIIVGLTIIWIPIIYAFIYSDFDNHMGSQSSYIMNLGISMLYISMWLRIRDKEVFSPGVAWFKMIGSAFYSIYFFLAFPENYFLQAICPTVFVIDAIYVYLITTYKGKEPALE